MGDERMNKHLEELLKAAAKKFADKKKVASQPETQFRKGAEWMYDFLMNGSLTDTYRQTLCRDVMNRQGTDEVEQWKMSLIDELADMLAERDAMMAEIRESGRLIEKYDKQGLPYKESNPLYVHVKAKEQSISVWRDKLGLSNTVNPDRIRESAKKNDVKNDPIGEYFEGIR